jgi:membrane protein YdbS with pleckstrin-like domain
LKWEVEKCEINLEESMLALERGFVPVSKVQQVSQQGMQVKYKAEVATHEYTTAVAAANKTSKALLHTLCPILLKL